MGRTDNPSRVDGLPYPRPKGASLRRMHTEYQIGSSRAGHALGPSRPPHPRSAFWSTVMDSDRPAPALAPSGSFHAAFPPAAAASSAHVAPTQSFHAGTSASAARAAASRPGPGRSSVGKPFQCPDCHHAYASTHELSEHRQRHHPRQARPYQCDQCTVCFSQRSHLNQHVRTVHDKVRPHKCDECNKAFGKKYDLVSHKHAVHSNQRPHACEFCDKRFAKRSNLTRHKDKLHPETRRR